MSRILRVAAAGGPESACRRPPGHTSPAYRALDKAADRGAKSSCFPSSPSPPSSALAVEPAGRSSISEQAMPNPAGRALFDHAAKRGVGFTFGHARLERALQHRDHGRTGRRDPRQVPQGAPARVGRAARRAIASSSSRSAISTTADLGFPAFHGLETPGAARSSARRTAIRPPLARGLALPMACKASS